MDGRERLVSVGIDYKTWRSYLDYDIGYYKSVGQFIWQGKAA